MWSIVKDIYPIISAAALLFIPPIYFKYVKNPDDKQLEKISDVNKELQLVKDELNKELHILKENVMFLKTQVKDLDNSLDLAHQNRVQEALKLEEANRRILELKQSFTRLDDRVGDLRVELAKINNH